MGQALQKLRGGGRGGAALRGASPPRQPASHNIDPVQPSLSPSPQTVRQSVEVRPQAPEPRGREDYHAAWRRARDGKRAGDSGISPAEASQPADISGNGARRGEGGGSGNPEHCRDPGGAANASGGANGRKDSRSQVQRRCSVAGQGVALHVFAASAPESSTSDPQAPRLMPHLLCFRHLFFPFFLFFFSFRRSSFASRRPSKKIVLCFRRWSLSLEEHLLRHRSEFIVRLSFFLFFFLLKIIFHVVVQSLL